jgi:hypothetical protein
LGETLPNLKALLRARLLLQSLNNHCQAKNRFFGAIQAFTAHGGNPLDGYLAWFVSEKAKLASFCNSIIIIGVGNPASG